VEHLTAKGFTHAWRVTGLKDAKLRDHQLGAQRVLAKQAAGSHTRSVAKHWKDVEAEVIEVEAMS
jgi:hypothetical protein